MRGISILVYRGLIMLPYLRPLPHELLRRNTMDEESKRLLDDWYTVINMRLRDIGGFPLLTEIIDYIVYALRIHYPLNRAMIESVKDRCSALSENEKEMLLKIQSERDKWPHYL
jgi:hypothetical protein